MKDQAIALRAYLDWILLNLLWLPLTFQDAALMAIAVPAALLQIAPHSYRPTLAILASVSSLGAMAVPPVAGWLSDRAHRDGRPRHLFVLAGIAIDAAALIGLSLTHDIVAFGLLLVIAIIGANIAIAAYQAMLPESVPRESWGTVSGVRGAATLVGTVFGLITASAAPNPSVTFVATAMVILLATLSLAAIPNAPYDREETARINNWHDFGIVFLARMLLYFGLTMLMTFVLYFFSDVLNVRNPAAGTGFVALASLGGAIVSSIWLGIVSDRVPRRLVTALAGVPMAIAAGGFALAPDPRWMLLFAAFFGIGLGGVLSTGWALAMDTVPAFRDVARDLGLWGIATNLPNVVAPLVGGTILTYFRGTRIGYQCIFGLSAGSFALASLVVLRVGARPLSPPWSVLLRMAAVLANVSYLHIVYRIRGWGSLPRRRGATLIVANHQHDLESMALIARLSLTSAWRDPIFSITSRRMHEPGFFAIRLPWLRAIARSYNAGGLFRALGLLPLENELSSRSIAGLAWSVQQRHGPRALAEVFDERVAAQFAAGTMTSDLWNPAHFDRAQQPVRLTMLREPFRTEILDETRAFVAHDLQRLEDILRAGGSVYLTPEGRYSTDGSIGPMRRSLDVLAPLAQVYLAGVSYDVFAPGRLSMLYRLAPLHDRARLRETLAALRPVTVSQLIAASLVARGGDASRDQLIADVTSRLHPLPAHVLIDPELLANPERAVKRALAQMLRLHIVDHVDDRYRVSRTPRHAQFPLVDDMVAYQAAFFAQTLESAATLAPETES